MGRHESTAANPGHFAPVADEPKWAATARQERGRRQPD